MRNRIILRVGIRHLILESFCGADSQHKSEMRQRHILNRRAELEMTFTQKHNIFLKFLAFKTHETEIWKSRPQDELHVSISRSRTVLFTEGNLSLFWRDFVEGAHIWLYYSINLRLQGGGMQSYWNPKRVRHKWWEPSMDSVLRCARRAEFCDLKTQFSWKGHLSCLWALKFQKLTWIKSSRIPRVNCMILTNILKKLKPSQRWSRKRVEGIQQYNSYCSESRYSRTYQWWGTQTGWEAKMAQSKITWFCVYPAAKSRILSIWWAWKGERTRLSGVENGKQAELAGVPEPTNGEDHKQDGKPRWHGAKSLDCVSTQLRNPETEYMGCDKGKIF